MPPNLRKAHQALDIDVAVDRLFMSSGLQTTRLWWNSFLAWFRYEVELILCGQDQAPSIGSYLMVNCILRLVTLGGYRCEFQFCRSCQVQAPTSFSGRNRNSQFEPWQCQGREALVWSLHGEPASNSQSDPSSRNGRPGSLSRSRCASCCH